MKQLTKEILPSVKGKDISLPAEVWQLPEKVLQFGTGVLLRGLPDYYINEANNNGVFNGRVVVVKSTGGSSDEFAAQDGLYTHCIRGIADGKLTEQYIINAAISRIINANEHWQEVMSCAAAPQLQIIISNTTEVGIALQEDDDIGASPPQSFPGKLLAFLYKRYQLLNGSDDSSVVIIPTELIVDNGTKLKNIVHRLAQLHHLDDSFINWLVYANDWCSSLVDRIVPGALPEEDKQQLQQTFGYNDNLAIMSEPYNLWAIETNRERTRQLLSFSECNKGIIITNDIQKYRELKLRLLNATHTFSCGLAFLSRFNAVNEAMKDEGFYSFVHRLMYGEIIPCLTQDNIREEEAKAFADAVFSRFANPFIQHQWLAITLQYTGKIKSRCVPLLLKYHQLFSQPPTSMALGFAAYLLFMKGVVKKDNKYYGERAGEPYSIQDDEAEKLYFLWQKKNTEEVVSQALSDKTLWNEDLSALPHFKTMVEMYLEQLASGIALKQILSSTLSSHQ